MIYIFNKKLSPQQRGFRNYLKREKLRARIARIDWIAIIGLISFFSGIVLLLIAAFAIFLGEN